MPKELNYPIGHDIITEYEKELIASLPQLYPNKGERKIVETVLLKQFRLKLHEVFEEFLRTRMRGKFRIDKNIPLSMHEIPEICSRIDEMITKNRQLLATNTLFKPAFERIQQYRPKAQEELNEESRRSFIEALAAHGITDHSTLLAKGPTWFKNNKFSPYGGGKVFVGTILGGSYSEITLEILKEVADKLGFEKPNEQDEQQGFITALATHGITDRQSLLAKGPAWFMSKDVKFPPYGGGASFIKAILGKSTRSATLENMNEVANKLGFEKPNEQDERQKQLEILASHGITDRQSLLNKGSSWFRSKEANFPPYGKGKAFIMSILSRSIYSITFEIINEVANKLGFEKPNEQGERQKQLEILASHGITDRQSLLEKGPTWFASKEANFPPYGKGKAFIMSILDRSIPRVSIKALEEVADELDFEKSTEQNERQKQLEVLASHGITDRQSLLEKGPTWFKSSKATFPPYGKGRAFLTSILDRGIRVSAKVLEEVADILFPQS